MLQAVSFDENGFPKEIRFGKITSAELVDAIGLLRGTQVYFELNSNDFLRNAMPEPGHLCSIRVEKKHGEPYLFIKRVNPLR